MDTTSLASPTAAFNTAADENTNIFHECYCSDIHMRSSEPFPFKFRSFLPLSCYLHFLLPSPPVSHIPPTIAHWPYQILSCISWFSTCFFPHFRAALALANTNSFGSSCLQANWFPEPKAMLLNAAAMHSRQRSCCQGWNSSTTSLLISSRFGLASHTTALKHTSNTAQTMLT